MKVEKKKKIGFWTWYCKKIVTSFIVFVKALNPKAISGEVEALIGFVIIVMSGLVMYISPVIFHNLLDYLLPLIGTIAIGLTVMYHGKYRKEDC